MSGQSTDAAAGAGAPSSPAPQRGALGAAASLRHSGTRGSRRRHRDRRRVRVLLAGVPHRRFGRLDPRQRRPVRRCRPGRHGPDDRGRVRPLGRLRLLALPARDGLALDRAPPQRCRCLGPCAVSGARDWPAQRAGDVPPGDSFFHHHAGHGAFLGRRQSQPYGWLPHLLLRGLAGDELARHRRDRTQQDLRVDSVADRYRC